MLFRSKAGEAITDIAKKVTEGFSAPILGTKIKGIREIITEIISAPAEAFKKYGFLDQYTGMIDNMRQPLQKFGVNVKDIYGAVGELNQGFAAFATENDVTKEKLIETTTKLGLAGFSAKTVASSFTNLTRVFNQTTLQADATTKKIAALSLSLGQGQKGLEDFVALTPQLAGFGNKRSEEHTSELQSH